MSDPPVTVGGVGRVRVRSVYECAECGQQVAQWAGRCPGCGAWGTIEERTASSGPVRGGRPPGPAAVETLEADPAPEARIPTGFPGVDRVLGGGLVPASVVLLAGEPGIGKSTLLLHLVANLSATGHPCLVASGEESRGQVAARAKRLGLPGHALSFASGREL